MRQYTWFAPLCVGTLVGAFVLLPLSGQGIRLSIPMGIFIMVCGVLAAVGAVTCARLVAHRIAFAPRAAKFALVGAMNTLFELSFITAAFLAFGDTVQAWFPLLKTASFLMASGSAYYWNRTWTFESLERPSMREYGLFLGANIIGFLVNVSTASLLVNIVGAPAGIQAVVWANVSVITAVLLAMGFNFMSQQKIFTPTAESLARQPQDNRLGSREQSRDSWPPDSQTGEITSSLVSPNGPQTSSG